MSPSTPAAERRSSPLVVAPLVVLVVLAGVLFLWWHNGQDPDTAEGSVTAGVDAGKDGLKALDTYLVTAGPGEVDLVTTLTVQDGRDDRLVQVRVGDRAAPVPGDGTGTGGLRRIGPEQGARRIRVRPATEPATGTFVPLTLVFAERGPVRVDVPVWSQLVPDDDEATPGA